VACRHGNCMEKMAGTESMVSMLFKPVSSYVYTTYSGTERFELWRVCATDIMTYVNIVTEWPVVSM
jgi:hypothetical protein